MSDAKRDPSPDPRNLRTGPRFERAVRAERREIAPPAVAVDPETGVEKTFEEGEKYAPGADPRSLALSLAPEKELLRETVGARAPRILGQAILLTLLLAGGAALGWQFGYTRAEKEAAERILRNQAAEAERAKPKGPRAPEALPANGVELVEKALKAEAAGDLATADAVLAEIQQISPTTPGLLLRRAKLAVRRGAYLEAEQFLAESVQREERRAESRNLRALLAATKQEWPMAEAMFREAVDADPFDGRTYYGIGETLRKQGKLTQAVDALQGALRRDHDRADRDLYRFKLDLALAELDPRGTAAQEILADAKKSYAPPAKLAAAAAALLLVADTKGGLALLERVRNEAPSWLWREMRGDVLFRKLAGDPDVLAILTSESR
ncbi:MAG: hypothetical protein JSR82_02960 [Verrucomicrobia bacterium]|nr:hypothetical protein [Verrucomicrobiota bacterium]